MLDELSSFISHLPRLGSKVTESQGHTMEEIRHQWIVCPTIHRVSSMINRDIPPTIFESQSRKPEATLPYPLAGAPTSLGKHTNISTYLNAPISMTQTRVHPTPPLASNSSQNPETPCFWRHVELSNKLATSLKLIHRFITMFLMKIAVRGLYRVFKQT